MQQDYVVALWLEDEEFQNQAGALFGPVEMQQDGAGAPLGLGDRQPDCGLDGKAEAEQNHPAVGLGCAEMWERCCAALLHPQEVLEDYADPDMGVSGRKGRLSVLIGLVQMVGLDLKAQQSCVGPLGILQEDHMDLLGPGEEVRDCDGVLPAVMEVQDLWDAVAAPKRLSGLGHEGG